MNWIPAILIMSIIVIIGIAIGFMVYKTFENMGKTSEYFEQIAKDLIKIDEILRKSEEMIKSMKKRRNNGRKTFL